MSECTQKAPNHSLQRSAVTDEVAAYGTPEQSDRTEEAQGTSGGWRTGEQSGNEPPRPPGWSRERPSTGSRRLPTHGMNAPYLPGPSFDTSFRNSPDT